MVKMNNLMVYCRLLPLAFLLLCPTSVCKSSSYTTSIRDGGGIVYGDLPSSFDWRNIDGVDYTTPAKEQFGNSCEAYSLVAALETMIQYKLRYPFGCDLSEAHLYYDSGGGEWGTYIEDAADYLKKYGVPDESFFPTPTKYNPHLQYNVTYEQWEHRAVKIKDWEYTNETIEDIKRHLIYDSPVITYIHLYRDLLRYGRRANRNSRFLKNNPIYYHNNWGLNYGPHYVTIVGYNDNPGYWICKNSYGSDWGDNGFFNIGYGECGIEQHSIYLKNVSGKYPINYVDDDNKEGPWNGSESYPYEHVQDAINHSYQGYTIFILNGTYHENIEIATSLKIRGETPCKPVLDGNGRGDVIFICVPYVKIENLTIQHSGQDTFDSGIEIRWYGDAHALLSNNIIRNNKIGLYLYTAYGCIIEDNTISYNNGDGIHLFYSVNEKYNFKNLIQELFNIFNTCRNCKGFIENWKDFYKQFKQRDNYIYENIVEYNMGDGIELEHSKRSAVFQNTIEHNKEHGILLRDGSNQNVIHHNLIKENKIGIGFYESYCNFLLKNTVKNNHEKNIPHWFWFIDLVYKVFGIHQSN